MNQNRKRRVFPGLLAAITLILLSCAKDQGVPNFNPNLSAPSDIATEAGNGSAKVTWREVKEAHSYNLYWSFGAEVSRSNGNKINNIRYPYEHTGLTNNTTYYYILTSQNENGESIDSKVFVVTPREIPPDAPQNLKAIPFDKRITLMWDAVENTTGYNLYWNETGNPAELQIKLADVHSPVVHVDLENNKQYYYFVTALHGEIESGPSQVVSASPHYPNLPPPSRIAVTVSEGKAAFSWAPVDGAKSYTIYWDTENDVDRSDNRIQNIDTPVYEHSPLINETTYYYAIAAVNGGNEESELSVEVSVRPEHAPPGVPEQITAQAGPEQATISWSLVGDAEYYNVYSLKGGLLENFNIDLPPFVHTGLSSGSSYTYFVKAVRQGKEGPASAQTSVIPLLPPPPPPVGLAATAGDRQVTLQWDTQQGLNYNIYVSSGVAVDKQSEKISNIQPPYAHLGRNNNVTYTYAISSVNEYGEGDLSEAISATPRIDPPASPGNIVVTNGDGQVQLSWNAAARAEYHIFSYFGANMIQPVVINPADSPQLLSGLINGETYQVSITAVNSTDQTMITVPANPRIDPPAAPGNVFVAQGNNQVEVNWAAAARAEYYTLSYIGANMLQPIKINPANAPQMITELANGETYQITLNAVNSTGETGTMISATPRVGLPEAPGSVTVVEGDGQLEINWNAAALAEFYMVSYIGANMTQPIEINPASAPQMLSGLTNGESYNVTVTAVNSTGSNSAIVTANPHATINGVDLVVTSATVDSPNPIVFGQDIQITYTITNQGNLSTGSLNDWSGGFYAGFVLTDFTTLNNTFYRYLPWWCCQSYFRFYNKSDWVPDLGPGESYTNTVSVNYGYNNLMLLVEGSGPVYLKVVADGRNDQMEVNETNNEYLVPGPVITMADDGEDLVMNSVSFAQTTVSIGESIAITNEEQNIGSSNTFGHYVAFRLCDSTNTSACTLIGYRYINSLAAGAANTDVTQIIIPAVVTPGSYYLEVIADAWDRQIEANNINNVLLDTTPITVQDTLLQFPDLVVSELILDKNPATFFQGQMMGFTLKIKNQGGIATFPNSFYFSDVQVYIYQVNAANEYTQIFFTTIPELQPQQEYTIDSWIGATWIPVGNNKLVVSIDPSGFRTEADTTNNTLEKFVDVLADDNEDFAISNLTVNNPSVGAGEELTFTYTVTNQGASDTWGSYVGLQLIPDAAIANTHFAEMWMPNLPAGGSMTETLTMRVPFDYSGGYQLNAVADYYDYHTESDENNNVLSTPVTVVRNIDLAISNLIVADTVKPAGETTRIRFTTTNNGTTTAPSSDVSAFLSLDGVTPEYTFNETPIGNIPKLAPQQSSDNEFIVTLPFDVLPGAYTLVITVDQPLDANVVNNSDNSKMLTVDPLINGPIGAPIIASTLSDTITTNRYLPVNNSYDVLTNITIPEGVKLTVQAGVTLNFADGVSMNVNGALVLQGQAGNEITFTSSSPTPVLGSWGGIYVGSYSSNSMVHVDHIIVQYASEGLTLSYTDGLVTNSLFTQNHFGLYIDGTSDVRVENNEITQNDTGVYVGNINTSGTPDPVISGNRIHANTSANMFTNIYATPPITISAQRNYWGSTEITEIRKLIKHRASFSPYNPATIGITGFIPYLDNLAQEVPLGNFINGMYLQNDVTLSAGQPYIVLADIIVPSGRTLTIQAGAELQFVGRLQMPDYSGNYLSIWVEGSLIIQGQNMNPVVLTSGQLIPGQVFGGEWMGVVVNGQTASVNIDFAQIDYAQTNLTIQDTPNTDIIQNSVFQNANTGIKILNASPSIVGNILQNNDIGIEIHGQSSSTINGGNSIIDNSLGLYIKPFNNVNPFPIINNNTIFGNTNGIGNDKNINAFEYAGVVTTIDVSNNWWGTTVLNDILGTINVTDTDPTNGTAPLSPTFTVEPVCQSIGCP